MLAEHIRGNHFNSKIYGVIIYIFMDSFYINLFIVYVLTLSNQTVIYHKLNKRHSIAKMLQLALQRMKIHLQFKL